MRRVFGGRFGVLLLRAAFIATLYALTLGVAVVGAALTAIFV
jgi:hypothetical protein